jgi:hypothetical protein
VSVELGFTDEESERVEVLSGIAAGDLLLVGAARGITPGARVTVEEAGNAGARGARAGERVDSAAQGG